MLMYLGAGLLLVWLIANRLDAWWSASDSDAGLHLLGILCGMALALLRY